MSKKPITPTEFSEKVSEIKKEYDDAESRHFYFDELMFKTLKSLGYKKGIIKIENSELWYS